MGEPAASELVADLIVDVVAVFAAELKGVLAGCPGEVIDALVDAVIDDERPVGAVAESAVAGDADIGDAPTRFVVGAERQPEFSNDVADAGQAP